MKYNLVFLKKDASVENFNNLNIKELMKTCLEKVKEEYDINIKMSNYIVWNLQNKENYNPFVKRILSISKVNN